MLENKQMSEKLGNDNPTQRGGTPRRLSRADWAKIQTLVCSGRRAAEVAEAYGIAESTVHGKSAEEQWPTPQRLRRQEIDLERTPESRQTGLPSRPVEPTSGPTGLEDQPDPPTLISLKANELLEIARETPERFDQAAGEFAQAMVALGMREVPAPRTIAELVKWEALRRQFLKLDKADKTVGGLFDPVAPMRRVGPVRDAETVPTPDTETPPSGDPLAGFEV